MSDERDYPANYDLPSNKPRRPKGPAKVDQRWAERNKGAIESLLSYDPEEEKRKANEEFEKREELRSRPGSQPEGDKSGVH